VTGAQAETPRRARSRSWRGLLLPAALAFIVLVGLGTWQIQRKAWKEALIDSLTQRAAAAPVLLPPAEAWASLDQQEAEFRRVKFTAVFDHASEALVYGAASAFRPDVTGPGYWVFTPARLAHGGVVMVDRGFVPEGRQKPETRPDGQLSGAIDIVGALRWPEVSGWYTPSADPAHNLWFTRDPIAIAAAKSLGATAPFYVEQEALVPPGGLPKPGPIQVHLRDEHLQYALTWYGLAVVLVGVFVAWARGSRRPAAGNHGPERA
jgi:surfeit locus 1 family protein